ncbi:gamma-glutamyl peptidase 5-like [Momordica charantia]|uniref:Gamma-glutamyl peptidase 5-like n=1 Tax=Momordica charantia TaxID=3673 RepID=A0A6J1D605_MOMCH|nr:gamma-glutamyl peptidase 5-like [Momordica charantia]
MATKRFAVLLCAEDSEYVKKKYGGYFGVFVKMLGEEGEAWDLFRVAAGEFPADDSLAGYDGFVITGSCNDAHGDDPWICRLINLLRTLASLNKRILGICFGHQILGRALGGKTGRGKSGWDIGITTIHVSSSSKLFSSLKIPTALSVIECHRDEIYELPAKAEVIGRSEKTGIEMFMYGDHILGIQGHPEYTKDILLHLIDRLAQRKLITDAYGEDMKSKLEEGEADREAWKRLCINFLKGGL